MWGGPRVVSVVPVLRRVSRAWAWIQSHPAAADAALAVALLGAAVWSSHVMTMDLADAPASGSPQVPRAPDATKDIAGLAAVVLPLALRRRAPLAVLLASTAAFIAYVVLLGPIVEQSITVIALSLAVYSAATHGRARRRDWVCGICLVAILGLVVFYNPGGSSLQDRLLGVLVNAALFCALWSLGAALDSRRRRAGELLERTVELEREREENARRAVFDERVRIARELHDVVAHHVSMMGVQAGAARIVLGRDPVKAWQALASIEGSSRAAVVELHRLLGFLRQAGDPDDLGSQPGLGQLDGLAASISDSRLTVEVRVEGEPRPVAATIDVSAYRIVQEALTNVVKHSGASRADVHVRYWPDELELEIVDDDRGNGASSSAPGGLGLIGMRERAALHGGKLTVGPVAGGGLRCPGEAADARGCAVSIRVLLADDQAMVRAGFRMILESDAEIDVVGEAANGEQAVAATRRLRPDVVLMDIQMPGENGLQATRRIIRSPGLSSRVVILTTFERDEYVFDALQSGASGFLLKNAPPEELVRAVRVVAGGDALLAPSVTRRIIEQFASRPIKPELGARLQSLTQREREVLVLLARGGSNAELAAELFVSEGTIKTHVSSLLAKLGLRDRVQAVVLAYESGLVTPGG